MRAFAISLGQDYMAVKAAASLPWSNGPTEGNINRLKMVKRQMYGRAKQTTTCAGRIVRHDKGAITKQPKEPSKSALTPAGAHTLWH
jgi:hypothetical protein